MSVIFMRKQKVSEELRCDESCISPFRRKPQGDLKLCSLAIKTKNIDEAIDYYDEFIQIAPKDPNRHILRYQILRAQRAPIEQQIEALEEFKKAEYIEEWAYELAKLIAKQV